MSFDNTRSAYSTLRLPPGAWPTVFACLCAHFPRIPASTWAARMHAGRVLDVNGTALAVDAPYRAGLTVRYQREVDGESPLPTGERVLYQDDHLLVADKPHFLPVMPAGRYVAETLLARLRAATGIADLSPLHRLDRATAGLVLFATHREARAPYQALFRERRVRKVYEAIAGPLPHVRFPHMQRSRIERGEPFFRMRETPGDPNAETRIEVIDRTHPSRWRYRLEPITGRKHQLRVHMAALGAPIEHDPYYPDLQPEAEDDFERPLALLARSLEFVDPFTGATRVFVAERTLA